MDRFNDSETQLYWYWKRGLFIGRIELTCVLYGETKMGSGLVKEASAVYSPDCWVRQNKLIAGHSSHEPFICKQLSFFREFLTASVALNDEQSEDRHLICLESWKMVSSTKHRNSDGRLVHGTDLFCSMFLSSLHANDHTEDGAIIGAFRPHHGSRNHNSSIMLRRIVRYLLSIRHENRNAKHNLRALGRTHARIKIERPEYEVFNVSFMETMILFPGVMMSSDIVEAWSSLLRFAVDQMCFDKIVFRDHITLPCPESPHKPLCTIIELENSTCSTDSEPMFQKASQCDVCSVDTCDSIADGDAAHDLRVISFD
jgi:hemoglobin-like flavoprotein